MLNIVLVAGGLGTRFQKLSVFPKILLPLDNEDSILFSHLNNLAFKGSNFYLVINSKFENQVKEYLDLNGKTGQIKIVSTSECNGSYNTLFDIKDKLPDENLLFIWSDLIVDKPNQLIKECELCESNGIIFTINGDYRYRVESLYGEVSSVTATNELGNVPGIYYLKSKDLFKYVKNNLSDKNFDLIDAMTKYINLGATFNQVSLNGITEYKDLATYICLIKSKAMKIRCKNKTRFFNELKVTGDSIIKRAIIPSYYPIIIKELDWYRKYQELNASDTKPIPKVDFSYEAAFSIKMEYLEGYVPLHDLLDELETKDDKQGIKNLYDKIYDAVTNLHNISTIEVPIEQFKSDLKKEVVTKILDRCSKIRNLLINNTIGLERILYSVYEELYNYALSSPGYDKESNMMTYHFCHGDLNGSNILVGIKDGQYDIKFIDPRGYFGDTVHYGWAEYDFAKLLYCLFGYDDFNNLPQIYGYDVPQIRKTFLDLSTRPMFLNKPMYKLLVGVIYIGLAGYISQDILKINISFDYGLSLLASYCNTVQDVLLRPLELKVA